MKAVILVGGEGTRLRPLTCKTVKPMLPILNKPFLEHLLCYLRDYGVNDVVMASCYLSEQIGDYFGDGRKFGVNLNCTVEDTPLGTAGAVKNAQRYLEGDMFIVFNGDIFCDIDLGEMLSFHKEKGAKASIALTPVEDPSAYGVVETDTSGRVHRFIEKPPRESAPSNLINAGIYILNSDVLNEVPPGEKYMFEHHLFPSLLQNGDLVYGFSSNAYWIDMGTPEKYMALNHDLLNGVVRIRLSELREKQNVIKDASAQISGPVIIGDNCKIGPDVRITGPAILGSGCEVGAGVSIDKAILWNNVRVGERAQLSNCVIADGSLIGNDSLVPHGTILADDVVVANGYHLEPDSRINPATTVG